MAEETEETTTPGVDMTEEQAAPGPRPSSHFLPPSEREERPGEAEREEPT